VPSTIADERATNPFLRAGEPAVFAAAQRHAGRTGRIDRHVVVLEERVHGEVVADDNPVEPEVAAEQVAQDLPRRADRDAVDLAVGVHHRRQLRLTNSGLERRGVHLQELTARDVSRRPVQAAL